VSVLVVPPYGDEQVWLAARRQGIGASEIAAVLGISPWDSAFSLHWRKREGWEVEPSEEMRVGTLVEPVVADWWTRAYDPLGGLRVDAAGLHRHESRAWQLATPDRLLWTVCDDCPDQAQPGCAECDWTGRRRLTGVLECKWTATWHGWGEPDTDDIPVYYRTQVLWQCDVMDVDRWHLAVLGPAGFRAYAGRRDERDLRVMRTAGAAWWADLQAGTAPDVDGHTATADTLRRLHPTVNDVDVEVPVELAEGYRRARALRSRAADLVDRYEARIRTAIGSGRRAMCGGRLVASRSVYDAAGDMAELDSLDTDRATVNRLNPGRAATYAK
jgi:putative phage-type endonuclease